MLDLCPRCQIQAPHRDGRDRCPRCGGPLTIVASEAQATDVVARYSQKNPSSQNNPNSPNNQPSTNQPSTSAPPNTWQPPTVAPAPRSQPPRSRPPRSQPPAPIRAPRMYRSQHVRWVARRPPESIPPPRPPRRNQARLIPRYVYLPAWGLIDRPVSSAGSATVDKPTRLGAALTSALQLVGATLAASVVAHGLRYILLIINRTTPLPAWLITVSTALILVAGVLALAAFAYVTVIFVRWVIALRADAYGRLDRADPRRRPWLVVLAGIPLVNVLGAPLLLHEAAAMREGGPAGATGVTGVLRDRLVQVWWAWVIVNAIAVAALITRVVAWQSESIQTGANALVMVILSAAVSACFAYWAARRLPSLFDTETVERIPDKRWVAVA